MAPTSNSAQALQQNRTRPGMSRPVMPAIPLSYGQKRQRQEAARAKAREEVQTTAPTSVEESSSSTAPPPTNSAPIAVNGSSDTESEKAEEISQPETQEVAEESAVVESSAETPILLTELSTDVQDDPAFAPSEAPSTSSKSTYQMPPPFVPASRPTNHSPAPSSRHDVQKPINNDLPSFPHLQSFNGHHPLHQGHPSTSSLVFGGYPESNNSSPAPPPSTSHFPPPPFPQNGHHPHPSIHHAPHLSNGGFPHLSSNGYSPVAPPPGYYPHMNGPADFPRRQMMPYGPVEGYSPVHTPHPADPRAYDPPTPHSFQGSQSSAHAAEGENVSAAYNPYTASTNGTNGHAEDLRAYAPPRAKRSVSQFPVNFPASLNGQPPHPTDHLDGLVPYLQSHFSNPNYADSTLELRYTDDRERPAIIPGHRLIFARCPTLKDIMSKQPQNGEYGQNLLVESGSPFLRSDAFAMAVQRLYGWPLIDHAVLSAINPRPGAQLPELNSPGSADDRFSLGLAYATAGNILQIPPVVSRGLEIASHFINWNTIEKALDFHFEAASEPGSQNGHDQPLAVPGAVLDILHQPATTFLITSFPAAFKLNSTVEDYTANPRLPGIGEERPVSHTHRLSFIKFGEYGSEDPDRGSDAVISTLSKILINLPFPTLKYVLESSRLGNVQGWATANLRQEVMYTVIEEREKRRLKVHASKTPNAERQSRSTEWDVVGWQESVEPMGGNESRPTLGRTWVGFTSPSS